MPFSPDQEGIFYFVEENFVAKLKHEKPFLFQWKINELLKNPRKKSGVNAIKEISPKKTETVLKT